MSPAWPLAKRKTMALEDYSGKFLCDYEGKARCESSLANQSERATHQNVANHTNGEM